MSEALQNLSMADNIHSPWMKMLLAKPVRNQAATVEDVSGGVRLSIPINKPKYMVPPISWIIRLSDKRNVVLENIGKTVWDLCDGKITIEQIVDRFAKQYHLSFHESRILVTDYIRKLTQRGVLAIVVPPEFDPEKSASQARLEMEGAAKPAESR